MSSPVERLEAYIEVWDDQDPACDAYRKIIAEYRATEKMDSSEQWMKWETLGGVIRTLADAINPKEKL